MSATTRDVTISVQGVPFVVTVLTASVTRPNQEPRRYHVRVAGSKHELDEVLDAGVLSELDRRIRGGEFEEHDEDTFDVPTGRVPA
jgi:hypothetical protein